MTAFLKRIADSKWFQHSITVVILLAGVLVGLETDESFVQKYKDIVHLLDKIILIIFIIEIVIKIGAEGSKPWLYFTDPWNVFDFTIVAVALLPIDSQYVTVLRLLRLLRVLRLLKALPQLQVLVGALLKSIPSMVYVGILLTMLFYVYAVAAVFLFGKNDPIHFASLGLSMLSLFRAVTLEDWTDLMYIQMYGCENYGYDGNEALCTNSTAYGWVGAGFFVSFVLLGTMIILNLFIGVIMNGMDEAHAEQEMEARKAMHESEDSSQMQKDLSDLTVELTEIQDRLTKVQHLLSYAVKEENKKQKES